MKRRINIVFALLLHFIFGAALGQAQDKIRMGLSSVSGLHTAVWVAETKGLFRKHGIDIEVIVTGQGGTAGISALHRQRRADGKLSRRCLGRGFAARRRYRDGRQCRQQRTAAH